MDWQLGGVSPFTYIVGEHARAVIAIQNLQKEVSTLLNFRENVLDAIPQLRARTAPANSHDGPTGETSSHPAPTSGVVDSGFSTDKASTSMGKSSSSSSGGELSGSARWENNEADARLANTFSEDLVCTESPLETAEDELWQLLEVIQRKGSRLKSDLQKAEMQERDIANQGLRSRLPTDNWPHSLPPPLTHRLDSYSLEAIGEVERLRWDRSYLLSRVSRAEAEAAISHSRLVDLHSQLMSLATEKRRLEEAFHAYGPDHLKEHNRLQSEATHPTRLSRGRSNSSVTVNINNDSPNHMLRHMACREEEVILPRVLKVPIRDKSNDKGSPRTTDSKDKSDRPSAHYFNTESPLRSNSNRVVIERQRTCSKVDGGLSMPASFFKGSKIKVKPDKQRFSAILREKDVLALQKQLLTTVMETEVLKRHLECCNEELSSRNTQMEHDQKKSHECIAVLTEENKMLKKKIDSLQKIPKCDVGTLVKPFMKSVAISTEEEEDNPTFTVHEGPNVKYDVVIYEETPRRNIEKPPRKRTQTPRMGVGVETLSPRLMKSTKTPNTPRSSPASSLTSRNNRPSFASLTRRETPKVPMTPIPMRNNSHKVSTVVPHFRASTSPSLTNRAISLSPDSLSPARIKRRTRSPPDGARGSLSASHFIRNSQSTVNSNRYLPKAPTQKVTPSKLLRYFPIDKASMSYIPVSISQKYLNKNPPKGRYYRKIPADLEDISGMSSCDSNRFISTEFKESDYKMFARVSTDDEILQSSEELDRSASSTDEQNAIKSPETKHKALWRKSSGAVRLKTIGRPSVLSLVTTDTVV